MSKCRLIHGDCLEEMDKLIDEGVRVDMILTDPPYLMNYHTGRIKDKSHDFRTPIANDTNFELIKDVMPLLYRLLKMGGGIYMFCNSNHIDYFKQQIQEYFDFKNILIWIKNNHSAGDLVGAYGKKTEFIIYASKGKHILNGNRDVDTLFYDRVVGNKQVHQNQKPVKLLEYLIGKSSNFGETVLDCFMGSGSTGVACLQTNRNFIGIELDEKYYNIAKKRCSNYQSKLM
jgi:site-specific DNA-methyltransferase (adenine-specific)